ncbi:MAG: MFS transporter [Candidatus Thorarchaeota archaeon]
MASITTGTPSGNHVVAPGPYAIVFATSFGVFLTALDSSIVNVSLVTMASFFGVGIQQIQWVVTSYLVVLTSAMPLMGKLGDRIGKTGVFQNGMLVFILGSFFCAMSTNLSVLVMARVFQSIGGSMMAANGLALVTHFTTVENRGRAMGLSQIVLAAALGLGPVIGGILTQHVGWQSIFLINLPIGLIGYVIVRRMVPQTDQIDEVRFDILGFLFLFGFLFLSVYVVSTLDWTSHDFSAAGSGALLSVALVLLLLFIIREKRFVSPLIPTRVVGDRGIASGLISAVLSYMCLIPVSFLMPFFLQEALGWSQSQTGMFLTIHPLTISVTGPIAGLLSERIDARTQTVGGLALQLVGLASIALFLSDIVLVAIGIVVMGFGLSTFSVANVNYIMTRSPRAYRGVVSALTNISRTAGFSMGTALASSLFGSYLSMLGYVSGDVLTYSHAVQLSMISFCLLLVVSVFVTMLRVTNTMMDPVQVEDGSGFASR